VFSVVLKTGRNGMFKGLWTRVVNKKLWGEYLVLRGKVEKII